MTWKAYFGPSRGGFFQCCKTMAASDVPAASKTSEGIHTPGSEAGNSNTFFPAPSPKPTTLLAVLKRVAAFHGQKA
jgi:hypothetical protein